MPELDKEEFKFPDEQDEKVEATDKNEAEEEFSLEIEDDTPVEDREVEPLSKDIVESLEKDDLSDYSRKVRTRLAQMKKVWHDERREKDAANRERQEALDLARRAMEENKRLKTTLSEGEKQYVSTVQGAADMELEMAKRSYRDAYDSGDTERIIEAQQKLTEANLKQDKAKNFRPTLQTSENNVQIEVEQAQNQTSQPKIDPLTARWLSKNTWYGPDVEMTALALGMHRKMEQEYGASYAGSEEYFKRIDSEMRKRFPENFLEETQTQTGGDKPGTRNEVKSSSVVAPATRSMASKRIVLKTSQIAIAKRLGLTPEQYAREVQKLEI